MTALIRERTHAPAEPAAAVPARTPRNVLAAREDTARPRGIAPATRSLQTAVADAPRPIDAGARALLEHRFGQPLGGVRIHTGPSAADVAREAGAEAVTVGNDVLFGAGRYDPASPAGLELLAHEVAHTVQQRNAIGPGGPVTQFAGVSERSSALEREADAAARHVVAGPGVAGGAGALLASRATGPVMSRRAIAWTNIPGGPQTAGGMVVDQWEKETDQIVRFKVPTLTLPREKGPVKEAYTAALKAGGDASGLEATIEFDGKTARAGLWESRAPTPDLNRRWLAKVGWTAADANAKWFAAGGKKGAGFPTANPGVACSTCDIDHIVELQLGGSNSPSNLTPLNSAENQKSGRDIWQNVSGIARELRPIVPDQTGKVNIILSFQDVDQAGGWVPRPAGTPTPGCATCSCSDVDAAAVDGARAATAAAGGTESYPVVAGGQSATFVVPPGEADVGLLDDQANINNAEVIPGMILELLQRPKAKGHTVKAFIESKPHFKRAKATRLPLAIQGPQEEVVLDAIPGTDGTRRLKIKGNEHPRVNFTYPYLSAGWLKLDLGEAGLTGDGQLTPSVPFLRNSPIDVHFGGGAFTGILKADPKRLQLPIPGFKVTAATIKVDLAPELAVTGNADFALGKLITGHLEAQPSLSGIWLKGDLFAHIPRIDEAKGEVEYKDGQLKGSLTLKAEQLGNLPGNPRGELKLGIDSKGLTADGKLSVSLPGGKPLDLEAKRSPGTGISLSGRTSFEIPGLSPLEITIGYDGEHFNGQAATGVTYKGLTGKVTIKYYDGKFSGETDATFDKGRLAGRVHLVIESDGSLSGEGEATVRITKDLSGKISVTKPKGGEIGVKGELILPDPITLFPEKAVKDTLFSKAFSFNIFGPVILQIRPSIGYAAGVGPGTINKAKVGAGFKPFAAETDFELWASATLKVPAYAEITAAIGLGVGLGLGGAASVAGGIEIAGTLRFGTEFSAAFDIHYKDGVFTAKALIEVGGGLKILVDINGYVHAEALGFDLYDHKWNLKHFEFDTGLSFLLGLPLEYASNKPFVLPSRDQMTLKGPDFSIDQMTANLRRTLGI